MLGVAFRLFAAEAPRSVLKRLYELGVVQGAHEVAGRIEGVRLFTRWREEAEEAQEAESQEGGRVRA